MTYLFFVSHSESCYGMGYYLCMCINLGIFIHDVFSIVMIFFSSQSDLLVSLGSESTRTQCTVVLSISRFMFLLIFYKSFFFHLSQSNIFHQQTHFLMKRWIWWNLGMSLNYYLQDLKLVELETCVNSFSTV